MQRTKLFVSIIFMLFAGGFFGRQWLHEAAAGGALPPAPTGVAASDGDYIDKVNVMWHAARGASLYRVYRATTADPAAAADVGTTAANYFFDRTAQPDQQYFYWVRAENAGGGSGLSAADEGRRAVGQFQSQIFSPLSPPPVPAGNAVTAAKAALGKALFWDEQLSSTWTVACGTCHRPASGGSDPRTVFGDSRSRNPGFDNVFNTPDDVFGSPGVPLNNADGTYAPSAQFGFQAQVTTRKSPSYLNSGFAFNGMFWDGRASNTFRDPLTNAVLLTDWGALESQVLGPPVNPTEMGHGGRLWPQAAEAVAAVRPLALASEVPPSLAAWIGGRTYPQLFEEAFGSPEVTPARIAMAIATHERTLFSDRTPLDRWIVQLEQLTPQEDRGRQIFEQVNCSFCHGGPLLADQNFHNVGVRPPAEDPGRAAVTGNNGDRSRFKTPSLRNVELRAPYMHNGGLQTLEEVVEFYNRGGDFDAPNINRGLVRPLNLTPAQRADLVAFLKRPLTDSRVRAELPPFDRPRLYSESNRVPVVVGTGRAGTGGLVPQPVAIEPPLAGNPGFSAAVTKALGNAPGVLVIDASDPGVGATVPASGSLARVTVQLAGTGEGNGHASVSIPLPNDPALVGRTFYGRWYITDAAAPNGFSVTPAFRFTIFAADSNAARKTPFDFDGDGKTEIGITRPNGAVGAEWWYSRSLDAQTVALQFGVSTDRAVPADFTGDGKADVAFWRPSTGEWFVLRSEDFTFYSFPFGQQGDVPVTGDFDADGKADSGVFRPSIATWFVNLSSGGALITAFGAATDKPVVADYDGDSKADIAIYRNNNGTSEWWYRRSSDSQTVALQFGAASDVAVPGDYTGDGKTDVAFWRSATGEWFILRSEDGSFYSFPFGGAGDVPAPGDYDGDGKWDAAVFRPSTANWFVQRSTAGTLITAFGASGDVPIPSVVLP